MSSTQEVGNIFGEGKGIAHAMLRSPTVLIVSIGLWGMNIFFFKLFKIDYKYVLMFDIHKLSKEYDEPLLRRQQHLSSTEYTAVSTGEEKKTDNNNSAGCETVVVVDIEEAQQDGENSNSKDPSGLVPTNPYPGGLENRRCSGSSSTKTASNQQQQIQPLVEIMKSTSSDPLPSSATPDPSTTTVVTTTSDHNDHHTTIDWYKLVLFSLVLLALLHIISHYWMDHLNRNVLGAVFWFYGIVGIISLIPIPHMRWLSDATYLTLKRIFELIRPRCHNHKCGNTMQRPIPFVDVFVADAMCSLSKVFFDWGYLIHMACHYPNPVPQDIHSIIIPSIFAAIPYLIRARQCLIMYTIGRRKSDPHRKQHMANAIKYSTSIYPLCLSAYQKTFDNPSDSQNLESLLILLMVINASYSLYWDIVMDWGMMQNPTAAVAHAAGCKPSKSMLLPPSRSSSSSSGSINNKTSASASSKTTLPPPLPKRSSSNLKKQKWNLYRSCRHGLLRSKLRFGLRISLLIMVTDSILRFSWLLRFKPTWFPSPDAFILATQFLEVFRRAIWNLLRVEWENIKQKTAKKKLASLESGGGGGTTDNDEEESSDDDDDDDEFDDEYDDDDDDNDGYDEEELLLTSNASNDAEDGSNDPTTTSAAASADVASANSNKESGGGGGGMIQLPPLFSSAKNSVQKMGGGGGGVVGLSKMDRSRTSPPPSPEKFQKKVHTGIPHRQHHQRQRSTSPHTSSPKQRKKGGGGGGMSW